MIAQYTPFDKAFLLSQLIVPLSDAFNRYAFAVCLKAKRSHCIRAIERYAVFFKKVHHLLRGISVGVFVVKRNKRQPWIDRQKVSFTCRGSRTVVRKLDYISPKLIVASTVKLEFLRLVLRIPRQQYRDIAVGDFQHDA